MILCSAEPRIISCLPTHVINLVINDNSLEILYRPMLDTRCLCRLRFFVMQSGKIFITEGNPRT